jgi:hypothetical protein
MSTHASRAGLPGPLIDERQAALRPRPRTAAWVGTAGGIALLLIVVLAAVLVVVAANRPSALVPPSHAGFPRWLSGPLGGLLPGVRLSTHTLRWGFSIVMVAMFVCYAVALACSRHVNLRWAVTAVVLVHVVFLLSPPLLLTDAFNYLNYGRMGVLHGLNPYTVIPVLEPHTDAAFGFSNWHHLLSPYGPLFTLFSYALVPLGLPISYWALKLVIVLTSLAMLYGLWRCAEMLGRSPVHTFLFVGANPLVLAWGLGGDHNDFFMVAFIVLAIYLILRGGQVAATATRRRDLGAGAALVAAVAIKASAGILLPAFLIAAARRRALIWGVVIGGACMIVATIIAFGLHTPDLADQSQVVTGVGLPNLLGYFLGLGGLNSGLRTALNLVLLVSVAGCAFYGYRTRDWITAAGMSMLALLLTLGWELPWYVFWLLPLAALSRVRMLRVAALALSVYLIMAWVPVTNDVIKSINFRPTSTQLGQQHSRLTQRLLH